MNSKNDIINEIGNLDDLFNNPHSNAFEKACYAKLAILEFGGWIELAMDNIAKQYIYRQLLENNHIEECEKMIKKINSFKYESFKELLVNSFGMPNFLLLEKRVKRNLKVQKFTTFKSKLGSIAAERDRLAHTHISNVNKIQITPAMILTMFVDDIYLGLETFERSIRRKIG